MVLDSVATMCYCSPNMILPFTVQREEDGQNGGDDSNSSTQEVYTQYHNVAMSCQVLGPNIGQRSKTKY